MLFKRTQITSYGNELPTQSRSGSGIVGNPAVALVATDANLTLTVAQMSGGVVQFTGFSAGRQVTTPTAALILAAAPDMDIGDSFMIAVSCEDAFAATWVAGVGVTLAGKATTPASSMTWIVVTKTSATAVTWNVL